MIAVHLHYEQVLRRILIAKYPEACILSVNAGTTRRNRHRHWQAVVHSLFDTAVLEDYARSLKDEVAAGMSPAYAQNLLSSVNVVLEAMRKDRQIRVAPVAFAGQRTRVRSDSPLREAHVSLRRLLWAAYLTGFRQKDLRSIKHDQITVDGIKILQSKDGKHEIRQWTDSLRKLVRKELERSKSDWVFTNCSGKPWSMSAIQSAMRRLEVSWTFHDLRAKADSDHETGLGLMRRYNRARRLRAVK